MIATLVALVALGSGVESVKLAGLAEFGGAINRTAKLRAIKSLIPEMAGPTAAKIVVDPSVGELKVTLHVTDRRLGWVLDQIADVLDLEWQPSDEKLKLTISSSAKASILKARKERDERNHEDLRRQYLEIAEKTRVPFAEAISRLETVPGEVEDLLANRPAGWSERLRSAKEKWNTFKIATSESNQVLGFCARQFGPLLDSAIRERKLFLASTAKLPGAILLDSSIRKQIRDSKPGQNANYDVLFAAYATDSHLYYTSYTWTSTGTMWADLSHALSFETEPRRLARNRDWGQSSVQIVENLPDVSFHAREPLQVRPNLTSSDILVHAAEAMDIDLVADAFHDEWMLDFEMPTKIAAFWARVGSKPSVFDVKVRDKAVLARHSVYWHLREEEVPEDKLIALAASVRSGKASLDAFAEFVTVLSNQQRNALALHPPFRQTEDLFGLTYNLEVLKFWNSLQRETKARALRHEVVPFGSLNSVEQDAYRFLVLRGLATDFSGIPYASLEPVLSLLSGQTKNLALLVEPHRYRAVTLEIDQVKITVPIEETPGGTPADRIWDSLIFRFGTNARNSIIHTLDMPVKSAKLPLMPGTS